MAAGFAPETAIAIQASPATAFNLLCDRSTWPDWNSFVPRADLLNPGSDDDSAQHHLQVGQQLKFHVQNEVFGWSFAVPGGSVEEITGLKTPDGTAESDQVWQVDWDQRMIPPWLLQTHRVNEIRRDPDNSDGCIYYTRITFQGPLTWIVKMTSGSMVQGGLEKQARGLKTASERT